MRMKGWLIRNRVYLGLLTAWLIVGAAVIVVADKRALHLALNAYHGALLDEFFQSVTYLGDRRLAWLMGLIVCFNQARRRAAGWVTFYRIQMRGGVAILCATIGAGLASEWLKHLFGPVPRPFVFFGEPSPLHPIAGFKNHLDYSMPSGHAAIAFALFTTLALQTASRRDQGWYFGMALLAAYSRVYLSEHFFEDVYAGSLLGMACALLAHTAIRPPLETARELAVDGVD